jgi:hypothetical protein
LPLPAEAVSAEKSRTQAAIEAQLDKLEPGSERHTVLTAARDFKASWVDLGAKLSRVRDQETYTEWGHASFEAYCRRELHIKSATADKLTRSYTFLRDNEPRALEERDQRELPPLDVVDLLSQARDRSQLSAREIASIQEEVFAPGESPTKTQVVRRFRELDPDAFKPAGKSSGSQPQVELRKALLLAERLQGLLEVLDGVGRKTLADARSVTVDLRQRLEANRRNA